MPIQVRSKISTQACRIRYACAYGLALERRSNITLLAYIHISVGSSTARRAISCAARSIAAGARLLRRLHLMQLQHWWRRTQPSQKEVPRQVGKQTFFDVAWHRDVAGVDVSWSGEALSAPSNVLNASTAMCAGAASGPRLRASHKPAGLEMPTSGKQHPGAEICKPVCTVGAERCSTLTRAGLPRLEAAAEGMIPL
eukprot:CAMPEP_0115350704 /NCGR_PEP_ID=MMETSP0270-20121206/96605_1 /TAXON_ID=71861 /ORGANISM="Scrippsiella trochoidea, Strain CCMP3099" /LENGTH=196 /DNA_ID=CAMNT_0002772809 /DNA_START=72 /DNA_END=663 /DNA_ORIENTATION=-